MYNITLISTRHDEYGLCTHDELYKIIAAINPEVIFEEIPPSYFNAYYVAKTRRNLESDAINKYLENHNIPHIPVDSDDVPPESCFKDLQYMHERVERLTDRNGFDYRNSIDRNKSYTGMYGFKYLNSIGCMNLAKVTNDAIENGLQAINDKRLFEIRQLWKDVHDKRETTMISNIYNYSKEHAFDNAVFTLGSAHRASIIQKIQEHEKTSEIKLNWIFSLP